MRRSFEDITGKKFNKLTVVEYIGKDHKHNSRWNCICECGGTKNTTLSNLKTGNTKSCGCDKNQTIEKMAEARKIERSSLIYLYREYKQGAKARGYIFELELDEFENITSRDCIYCGIAPNQKIHTNGKQPIYIYNGIDRLNNLLGYTIDNCAPFCKMCNWMKLHLDSKEFLDHIKRIYIHSVT